eukprot:3936818-Rhodomonas_salina.1
MGGRKRGREGGRQTGGAGMGGRAHVAPVLAACARQRLTGPPSWCSTGGGGGGGGGGPPPRPCPPVPQA